MYIFAKRFLDLLYWHVELERENISKGVMNPTVANIIDFYSTLQILF